MAASLFTRWSSVQQAAPWNLSQSVGLVSPVLFAPHGGGTREVLTTSLGEEQNAGQLLDQVAQPLLSVARMPATVE